MRLALACFAALSVTYWSEAALCAAGAPAAQDSTHLALQSGPGRPSASQSEHQAQVAQLFM